jgi:DNA mismatch endonuclease (patch repair protein)
MGDTFTPEVRSRIMRAVKGRDTSIEKKVRSALWIRGLRFRKNDKRIVGKPDIVFPRSKLVVFLDSCFWHGCPLHLRRPKSNQDYWQKKVARNMLRDTQVTFACTELGWTVLRIWEHELKENFDSCIKLIEDRVRSAKQ